MLVMSNREWFRYCWAWDKGSPTGFLDAKRRPLRCHEDIVVFGPREPRYNPQKTPGKPNIVKRTVGKVRHKEVLRSPNVADNQADLTGMKYPRSVLEIHKIAPHAERFHPTQKPVALMEYLIKTYSNQGDMVLDSTMGGGTTGVACINTGRNFIGIEKHEPYFRIAERRIKDAERPLFATA
jgi:site-specific DNA-methyltransferase (adenine-specific)